MKKALILFSIFAIYIIKPSYSYNPAHLELLTKNYKGNSLYKIKPNNSWNIWKKRYPHIRADLRNAIIEGFQFLVGNFKNIDFSCATFKNTAFSDYLINVSFKKAYITGYQMPREGA